jgi:asparagine synthase (glutamine-hydrolysing)
MCGIAGLFASRLPSGDLRAALSRMAEAMMHRGPDDGAIGAFPELGAGLAVRRLALVDVAGGAQPIANETGDVFVLLNGEIYNHVALRHELAAQGHRFRTRSDAEVLVHLYEALGDALLDRLDGMFALALLDVRRRRLLLARDGPGMKPLYFARTSAGFAFASEVKALLAAGLVTARPDAAALDVYLAAGFVPAPRTLFAGVEKLAAGHRAVVDDSGFRIEPFWRFAFRSTAAPLAAPDAVAELERRLADAVTTHLQGDAPVGAYLSGGWDSSLVTALAVRAAGRPLPTFSIVFPDHPEVDERRHARLVANWLGTTHREVEFRAARLPDLLPRVVRHLEEPVAAAPAVVGFVLAEYAARHVKAVVGGEGADELFAGYPAFRRPYPFWIRAVLPRAVARIGARRAPEERVRCWLRVAGASDARAADLEWRRFLTAEEKRELLRAEWRRDGPDLAPLRLADPIFASCHDRLERHLAQEFTGRLPEAILFEHDKMAMAHSLEVRMPFLDRGVVDFAARLPSDLKLRRGREKVIVGALARRLLPPEIAARRKQGLGLPPRAWVDPPAGERLRQLLLDGAATGPFEPRALERRLARTGDRRGRARLVTNLAMLQTWWNEFLE